jgi:hypothetical protein
MKVSIDFLAGGGAPKRGDILQTNIGDRRERTFLIIKTRRLRPINGVPRYSVWAERWWEFEPELRVRLFESAERSGGQKVIEFSRYPAKKKSLTFEQHMRRAGF